MTARAQQGFALLEFIAAALLMTLLAVWGANTLVNAMNDARAQDGAVWMLSLRKAAQDYLERYVELLAGAEDPQALAGHGYADWTVPSLAELKADTLLSPGFPERAAIGGATLRIVRDGACPGRDCRVHALVHSNGPLLYRNTERIDAQSVARFLMAARGMGGWVMPAQPLMLRGAAFAFPNPSWPGPALPAGTVAMAVTTEQLDKADFLRVGDARDPDFQGPASIRGDVLARSDLLVDGYLRLAAREEAFASCSKDGAVARESEQDGLLICRDGSWRSASRGGAGGFSTNQLRGCYNSKGTSTANPVTGACSCPPGAAMVQISDSGPQDFPEGRTVGYLCLD
ncbi:prepilin [Pollutimonas sp. M17]|uniref:prepilin n=1 Tax=Pollutimonas sp. M17 TaxID=2962065 RepID=UPI0021F4AF06|nr:prepilin [Pollutimonas sp. M17]UYO92369.1 prepilin [Pollutimonas sp. M17]